MELSAWLFCLAEAPLDMSGRHSRALIRRAWFLLEDSINEKVLACARAAGDFGLSGGGTFFVFFFRSSPTWIGGGLFFSFFSFFCSCPLARLGRFSSSRFILGHAFLREVHFDRDGAIACTALVDFVKLSERFPVLQSKPKRILTQRT